MIWLCNPNNPTGEVREKEVLTACIKQNPQRIFVMDQSYEFFTQKALLTAREAAEFPNVILLHSMTKRFAVPGLRLGYITACKELLHEIRTQRMPWSVNQLAIEAGHYLLSSSQYDIDISLLLKEKEISSIFTFNRRNGDLAIGYSLYVSSIAYGKGSGFERISGNRAGYPYS